MPGLNSGLHIDGETLRSKLSQRKGCLLGREVLLNIVTTFTKRMTRMLKATEKPCFFTSFGTSPLMALPPNSSSSPPSTSPPSAPWKLRRSAQRFRCSNVRAKRAAWRFHVVHQVLLPRSQTQGFRVDFHHFILCIPAAALLPFDLRTRDLDRRVPRSVVKHRKRPAERGEVKLQNTSHDHDRVRIFLSPRDKGNSATLFGRGLKSLKVHIHSPIWKAKPVS